ncbi:hypothetical protein DFH09DRAFT_1088258 [Mycena vulgaris]|nr:hypothetical protein DFH09DRAFT_1088258 [Mycena vulgaris]
MTLRPPIYITRVTECARRIGTSGNGETAVSEPKDPTCLVESEGLRSGIVDWYAEDGRKTQELNSDQVRMYDGFEFSMYFTEISVGSGGSSSVQCRFFEFEQSWIDDEWKRIRSLGISLQGPQWWPHYECAMSRLNRVYLTIALSMYKGILTAWDSISCDGKPLARQTSFIQQGTKAAENNRSHPK